MTQPQLWTASAGGFSATVDAFALEDTGSSSGDMRLWFLSMLGPQQALKAVWGSILKLPASAVYITPGADGLNLGEDYHRAWVPRGENHAPWTTRLTKLPAGLGYHAMVYSRAAEYGHESDDFLLLRREDSGEEQAHRRFLDRRVTVPLHPAWDEWLWQRGLDLEEIIPLQASGIRAWICRPNPALLERDISEAVRNREIGA